MGNRKNKIKAYLMIVGEGSMPKIEEEDSPFEQLEMDFVKKYLNENVDGDESKVTAKE